MVASSLGMSHVARPAFKNETGGLVRLHWQEVGQPDGQVQSPVRALAGKVSFLALTSHFYPFFCRMLKG